MSAALDGGRVDTKRVGIGGPVGCGKTALIEALVPRLHARGLEVAIVTNDLVTREDAERLQRAGFIDPERVLGVETGACPHSAIREDPTLNIEAAERLVRRFPGLDLIVIESGGDNLASTFSRELVDYWLFVIDVAGGDDIPRKRGPGLIQCDLLVVNKIDLAPHVRADLEVIRRDSRALRGDRPIVFTNCLSGEGIDAAVEQVTGDLRLGFSAARGRT